MTRNRILHPSQGWQYISIPVSKHIEKGAIKDVIILDLGASRDKIRGQIDHYRKGGAPYFFAVAGLIDDCFSGLKTNLLRDLNVRSLELVCDYLGVAINHTNLSEMSLDLPEIQHPGQWALEISCALGADAYLNPPGGRDIFRPSEWEDRGVRLEFTELVSFVYTTRHYTFIERLSIIVVLMWNSPEAVKTYLDSRRDNLPT